jgi:hypothetical protein
MKSDYRYSNEIVYNNFPWPINVTEQKKERIEVAVLKMLKIRKDYLSQGNTLAELYNNSNMQTDLRQAHEQIDKLVDKCFRETPFTTDIKRIEYLFNLYEEYNANLFTEAEKTERKVKKKKVE